MYANSFKYFFEEIYYLGEKRATLILLYLFPESTMRSSSPVEGSSGTKGLLTTGATKVKKKKKSVRWKEEHNIREIFYFDLDEEERGMKYFG